MPCQGEGYPGNHRGRVLASRGVGAVLRYLVIEPAWAGTVLLDAFNPSNRHQRWHIAPKVEAAKMGLSFTNPRLRALHVLNDHRNMMSCRFAGFPLNPKAGVKEFVRRGR